jgi:CBS domain-containing protein
MTHTIVVCREDDDVSTAIAAMEEYQIRRIPVIDQRGRIVGIISQADVATRAYLPAQTAELIQQISRAA